MVGVERLHEGHIKWLKPMCGVRRQTDDGDLTGPGKIDECEALGVCPVPVKDE